MAASEMWNFLKVLIILISTQLATADIMDTLFTDFSQFSLDENSRLDSHYLLYSANAKCEQYVADSWYQSENKLRRLARVSGSTAKAIFGSEHDDNTDCMAACLDQGTMNTHLQYIIPEKIYPNPKYNEDSDITRWIKLSCQSVEVGFVSHAPNDGIIYWINPQGERVLAGHLGRGENHMNWQRTFLGHRYEIVDEVTGEMYLNYTVPYNAFNVIGSTGQSFVDPSLTYIEDIKDTFNNEWARSRRVKRTFTELGFDKGKLPKDLWAAMASFYYNNRHQKVREEWEDKGLFVNWWEIDAFMIAMPYDLKTYWQGRLKDLVEAWSGVQLELTDIYGMRRYEEGARLLTHVDRQNTHAASLIVNIAQEGIKEPWMVEIYDFADRLHEIEMEEGDIVYYESARCLHGRMKPLRGSFYVNLFAHYRPVGDPEWFLKSNPPEAPEPLLDLGECVVINGSVNCSRNSHKVPYLSPALETLYGGQDLFRYWGKLGDYDVESEEFQHELESMRDMETQNNIPSIEDEYADEVAEEGNDMEGEL